MTYDYEKDDYHQYNHSIDHNWFDDSSYINSHYDHNRYCHVRLPELIPFFFFESQLLSKTRDRFKATEDAPFEQQAECQEAVCEAAQGAEGQSLPWNVGKGYRKNGPPQEMPNNASGCWYWKTPPVFSGAFWRLEMNTLKVWNDRTLHFYASWWGKVLTWILTWPQFVAHKNKPDIWVEVSYTYIVYLH